MEAGIAGGSHLRRDFPPHCIRNLDFESFFFLFGGGVLETVCSCFERLSEGVCVVGLSVEAVLD